VQDALIGRGLLPPRRNGHAVSHATPVRVKSAPKPERRALGRIVATYDYVDVTGELLFQVVRFEPKEFRQRRPDGGRWAWGLGRTRPVVYRLPEVLAAETVHLVEGEKDVERLRTLGLVATTSPMGAGKWRPEMGAALAGKHVIVLPDNDDPGRKHALDVAASAREHGATSIRIVELPKLPRGGDVSDWLDAGGDRGQLEELVRKAPLWGREQEGGDPGWRALLIEGESGPKASEANVAIALRHAPELAGRLQFDAFRMAVKVHGTPWDPRPEWRDWTDEDDVHLAIWLDHAAGISMPSFRLAGVVGAISRDHETHVVRKYLDSLEWDGRERIDDWLVTYLGCAWNADEPGAYRYLRAIGKRWLISAVARVLKPGCKADCALILEGPQGLGKSTVARILFGEEWFADQMADFGTKDSSQDLRGKWGIELAELGQLSRSEIERVKAGMSRSVDHYRPSYERRTRDIPRQCVFFGTTNEDVYLKDRTGNRRWWPAKVGTIRLDELRRDRDQLWAEAFKLFKAGEQWWLTREEEERATVEQAARTEEDTWSALIAPRLKGIAETTTREVLVDFLLKDPGNITRSDETRAGNALRDLGFRSTGRRHPSYGCRIYERRT